MPKIKNLDKDSRSYIKNKIRKWQRKLQKQSRRSSPASSDHGQALRKPQESNKGFDNNEYLLMNSSEPLPSPSVSCTQSLQVPNEPEVTQGHTLQVSGKEVPTENDPRELDESVLEILGPDPTTTTSFGEEIQKDLAKRYEFIATSGLIPEIRKELIESHLPPVNCKLIATPSLNPEIKVAIPTDILHQDKMMQERQKQISSAIACLSEASTVILSKEEIDLNVLKLLVDAGRILCDSQHNDSITRRNLVLAVLKKDLKDRVQLTKIDSLLFGEELGNRYKTGKANK